MAEVGTITRDGDIGILTIASPPVNALGRAVRQALADGMATLSADAGVRAIVIQCAGRTFFAGADISEFGKPPQAPGLHAVLDTIENCPKPVIAAIHGTALGGGFELALVCHYRIAVPSAKVGLPEVNLGLLPGAGGTQRLPRIVGAAVALDLMVSGRSVAAPDAVGLGMVDALAAEDRLTHDAVAMARRILADGRPLVRVRDRDDKVAADRADPGLFDDFRARNARAFRGFRAPGHIVKAVEAAVGLPFDLGMAREGELFAELMQSTESAAQRHVFFAERETAKVPDLPRDLPTLPIGTVGVVGAGTMGGGITMNFLQAGIPVTLVDASQEALDRGIATIRRNYEASVRRGRHSAEQVEAFMARITPTLDPGALAPVDLVIEAIFESMAVKKDMFARLDAVVRDGAILATNTSFLNVDDIAGCTRRPEWVVGLHFFSPANVMRLMEVVRGVRTRPDIIATAMALARTIGKVPVLSGVCDGFIANRLMRPRARAAIDLVLAGPTPQQIDAAIANYGFAMGPFAMADLVGLDVGGRDSAERTLYGDLVKLDRLGQKRNGGFYDYDEHRRATPSPVAARVIADFAAWKGVAPAGPLADADIVARLLYPVVNEGARILDEGIAIRSSDIDMAAILGYNWPVYTGGPMFWADSVGLPTIVAGLRTMGIGPAPLLERLALEGGRFSG